MKYDEFEAKVNPFAIFGKEVVGNQALQLHRWVQKGKLIRIKRGLYTLPKERQKTSFSLSWLANTIYSPSYLSLESVLSRYDLIPERVPLWTSVTRLKTARFENPLGIFSYRHLKKELFFGFHPVKDEQGRDVLMAEPEKALLDLLYFKNNWDPTENFLTEDLRLQQLSQLRKNRLKAYSARYDLKTRAAVKILMKII